MLFDGVSPVCLCVRMEWFMHTLVSGSFFADYIFAFSLLLFCSVKDDWYKLIKVEAEWDVPTVCNYHNDFKIMDRLKMKVKFNKTKNWNIKQVKFLARYELSINITWLEANTKIQSCIWFVVNVGACIEHQLLSNALTAQGNTFFIVSEVEAFSISER